MSTEGSLLVWEISNQENFDVICIQEISGYTDTIDWMVEVMPGIVFSASRQEDKFFCWGNADSNFNPTQSLSPGEI